MLQGLKVKSQLMLLSGVLLAFLVAVGALGAYSVQAESQAIKALHDDRVVPLKQLKAVSDMYAVNIVDAAHKARDGALTAEQARASVAQARSTVTKEWDAYLSTQLVPREATLVDRIKPLMQTADAAVAQLDGLLAAGDKDGLTAFTAGQMYPKIDPLQGVIADLIQVQLDVAQETYQQSVVTAKTLMSTVAFSVLGALVLGGGLALVIARRLTRALGGEPEQVRQAALAVAEGDLTHRLQVVSDDQHSVMAAMQTMIQKLQRIVGTVRENAQSVASASGQIAMGNQDLANRNETQASALEETAASMEELGSTVKQNADNARQANQLAQGASGVATEGGQVVEQVVDTMRQINESSKKIADIITVIDGIAFQTNILALNAAVEAARAGEQGRGFAVVAGEVRSLAQRSAGAAKEIKDLISASVERVEQGTQLVDRAGTTMTEIVNSIRRVTDIMGEISAANTEQSLGVAQVGQAVTLMDQATQQNASLVEESASAAAALNVQAERLLHIVSRFKLDGDAMQKAGTNGRGLPSAGGAGRASAPAARSASPAPASQPSSPSAPRPAPAAAPRAASPAPSREESNEPAAAAAQPAPAAARPAPKPAAAKAAPKPAPVITPMAGRAKAVSVPASAADDDWESF